MIQPEVAAQNFMFHKAGEYALLQTKRLAASLLESGQLKGHPQQEIQELVEKLASREIYASHGSVIDHKEATTLGLQIEYLPPEDPIWERIWLLYCMYEHDCRKAKYLKVFEGRARSTAISIPPPPPQTATAP